MSTHEIEVEFRERAEIEHLKTKRLCDLVFGTEYGYTDSTQGRSCQVLDAALNSAKTTMKNDTEKRVFVQDLAAALNRRKILFDVEKFWELAEAKII